MPDISFNEALAITLDSISPLSSERVGISELMGRVASEPIASLINTPSADISLKDGYAVKSADVANASVVTPANLKLRGSLMAGSTKQISVLPGSAVRIMSGAAIPAGAEAVVAEEFTVNNGKTISVFISADKGRNILKMGTDAKKDEVIIHAGSRLSPSEVGLIASAGHSGATVYKSPRVVIIATGDEVVAVGETLKEGMVFASNLVTISAWCSVYGMSAKTVVVKDAETDIAAAIGDNMEDADCLITSGGAWKGDRDLVVRILDEMGWDKAYHRVKMGPGKAVGFGRLNSKLVFCLPGDPPSNQMAFLQLALPGLLKLGGHGITRLPIVEAVLSEGVSGQKDWTQFIYGELVRAEGQLVFSPAKIASRLQFMARADAIACIPEGIEKIEKGSRITVQLVSYI
jgi:molybdopterin molybdotransferase